MAVVPFDKSVRCRQFPAAAQGIAFFIRSRTISRNPQLKEEKRKERCWSLRIWTDASWVESASKITRFKNAGSGRIVSARFGREPGWPSGLCAIGVLSLRGGRRRLVDQPGSNRAQDSDTNKKSGSQFTLLKLRMRCDQHPNRLVCRAAYGDRPQPRLPSERAARPDSLSPLP